MSIFNLILKEISSDLNFIVEDIPLCRRVNEKKQGVKWDLNATETAARLTASASGHANKKLAYTLCEHASTDLLFADDWERYLGAVSDKRGR